MKASAKARCASNQVGQRDQNTCWTFLLKLKAAISGNKFQLTTDGLSHYRNNVPYAFGMQVSFAQLVKTYSANQTETRYSPASWRAFSCAR
jgi:hypothetical protein